MIRTFARIWKRPTLVCLDFTRLRARRYFPKYPSGFLVDDATLRAPANQSAGFAGEIETFRQTGSTA